jgi:type IV fimbrial biogenesis protein FimT
VVVINKDSGVTFAELMVVFAIIAILAAVAVPGFSAWLPNYRLKQAARDVFSRFQQAKFTAIKRNTNCAITFNQTVGGNSYDYVVFVDADSDLEYDSEEHLISRILWQDYKSVSLDTSQGGGDGLTFLQNDDGLPAIAFQPNGLPINNSKGTGTGSVFLKNTNNKMRSVSVSSAGNIQIN